MQLPVFYYLQKKEDAGRKVYLFACFAVISDLPLCEINVIHSSCTKEQTIATSKTSICLHLSTTVLRQI